MAELPTFCVCLTLLTLPLALSLRSRTGTMPSINLSAAFFVGLLEKNRRLLKDPDFQALYNLDKNPLDGEIERLSLSESESLRALAAAAEPNPQILLDAEPSRSRLKDNAHAAGKAALAKWFQKKKIAVKIHSSIDRVLEESKAHPRQLLEDLGDEVSPLALPDEDIVHSDIELGVAIAVFGRNAVSTRLTSIQVKIIKAIMHHVWNRLRKERRRMHESMSIKKAAWLEAERGKSTVVDLCIHN